MTIRSERNLSLDILKVVLSIMVIGLHANFLIEIDKFSSFLFVNGLFRIAVPIFFIINGYFFYPLVANAQGKSNPKIKSWFERVLILYAVWTSVYLIFWLPLLSFNPHGIAMFIKTIFIGYYHLWYLPALLLAAFMFKALHQNLKDIYILALMFVCFCTGVGIDYVGNYNVFGGTTLDKVFDEVWVHRNFLFSGFPFFGLGWFLRKQGWGEKASFKMVATMAVVTLGLLFLESGVNYKLMNKYEGFDNYLSLALVCPAIFMFVSRINMPSSMKYVSQYSSALYFVHVLFVIGFSEFSAGRGTVLTLIAVGLSVVAAFILVALNKRLKYII
ncbi:MAG: hypothetical protein COA69_13850 [Robiginitomaculum sp.]|nr:MAG: hypothetical protein COA69_13850 [Robiginitomaculum sp.]